ncbi:hypothetical protein D9757_012399 [Collybiopsis confluens]|uniref:Uncharacterized protein n=1 Tax=Collybiopsis confluens TaxID=2823264 RepID=A0A8H5GJ62_9AGAR|nr:hypothetical protein D9757_012399 [Collybiopsis confluens]
MRIFWRQNTFIKSSIINGSCTRSLLYSSGTVDASSGGLSLVRDKYPPKSEDFFNGVARGLLMTLWSHENLNWFPYIDFRGFDASGAWLIARFGDSLKISGVLMTVVPFPIRASASFDADGFWREFQWGLVPSAFRGGGALQRLLEKHNNSSGLEPESLVSGILARYTYYGHEVHIQNIFEACGEDGSFIEVFTREFLPRNIHGTPIQKAFSPGIFLTKVSISVYFPLKVLGAFLVALRGMSARVPFALEVGMGTAVWYRLGIAYIWLKAGLTNPGSSDSITQHYCQITIANF